jgi:hypothetical protein
MNFFCTYFDSRYIPKGLALYRSLRKTDDAFALFVLCMDDVTHSYLVAASLPGIVPVALSSLETADPELQASRRTRSLVEYYFTCTAAWCLYVLREHPEIPALTYLDADLYFYSPPRLLLDELGTGSILICRHGFAPDVAASSRASGEFNVGFLCFRNDASGRECLSWWRERCIEWCYDRHEDGKYADQKYLEQWPGMFKGVKIVAHKGANVGPWNLGLYPLRIEGGTPHVDGVPIVFFHYHGVQIINGRTFNLGIPAKVYKSAALLSLYRGYVAELAPDVRRLACAQVSARGRWSSALYRLGKLVWDGAFAVSSGNRAYVISYTNPLRRVRY